MQGDAELKDAEDDYRHALGDQYRSAMMAKTGEDDDLGIGELADRYAAHVEAHGRSKEATLSALPYLPGGDMLKGMYMKAMGGYDNYSAVEGGVNAAALLAALGTGYGTYNWAKGRNKQELLDKALKKRLQQRSKLSPPPVLALTEPEDEVADAA